MTYEQIAEMMEEMGLPFAYHHFAEGESPAPPFLLFLSPGENTFSADNQMYFSFKMLDIELYTDIKNPELEKQIEQVLKRHKIRSMDRVGKALRSTLRNGGIANGKQEEQS